MLFYKQLFLTSNLFLLPPHLSLLTCSFFLIPSHPPPPPPQLASSHDRAFIWKSCVSTELTIFWLQNEMWGSLLAFVVCRYVCEYAVFKSLQYAELAAIVIGSVKPKCVCVWAHAHICVCGTCCDKMFQLHSWKQFLATARGNDSREPTSWLSLIRNALTWSPKRQAFLHRASPRAPWAVEDCLAPRVIKRSAPLRIHWRRD